MSIPRIGFAVSFDGCPYVFATDGVQSISTTDPNYPDNATVLDGWLIGPNEDGASTSRIKEASRQPTRPHSKVFLFVHHKH